MSKKRAPRKDVRAGRRGGSRPSGGLKTPRHTTRKLPGASDDDLRGRWRARRQVDREYGAQRQPGLVEPASEGVELLADSVVPDDHEVPVALIAASGSVFFGRERRRVDVKIGGHRVAGGIEKPREDAAGRSAPDAAPADDEARRRHGHVSDPLFTRRENVHRELVAERRAVAVEAARLDLVASDALLHVQTTTKLPDGSDAMRGRERLNGRRRVDLEGPAERIPIRVEAASPDRGALDPNDHEPSRLVPRDRGVDPVSS